MTQYSSSSPSLEIPKRGMPVTIITGFLGSGKTTLLNQILKNKENLKVAILVNEFGDINIDSQLLVSLDEDMVELSNGCICCTINDGLVDAVYRILEREDEIDYLVVETTGVADPLPIILTFLNTDLRDLTRLDSIITVVDTETFTPTHFDSQAALSQIVYGDIILLNKTDLVSESKLDRVREEIRDLKKDARMLRSEYGQVPLPLILDVELSNPARYREVEAEDSHEHHHHEHHHHHSHHLENDGFMSISFQSDRPFSVYKFQKFLDNIPENIFRAKGILWFQESQLRHIFQLSGKRCTLQTEEWVKQTQIMLVFIGRKLEEKELREALDRCLA